MATSKTKLENPKSPFAFWSNMFLLHVMLIHIGSLLQPNYKASARALGNDTDRFALLKIKEAISSHPHGILSMWNDSIHFCSWPGIACSRRHQRITSLDLSGNNLRGTISPYVGNLSFLRSLNLRNNSFFGTIPQQIGCLFRLQSLNISGNTLEEGEVPNEGVFQNISAVSIVGNTKLCGGVPKLHLQACPRKKSGKEKTSGLKLKIIVVLVVAFFLFSTGFMILYCRRSSRRKTTLELPKLNVLSKISYRRLFHATNGFSTSMLIGVGSFGSVYKGILDQEENLVAVKVLNLQQKGAGKSFLAECNALRNVRHRNLVKIVQCCSSIDYNGNEFKALVFEYMSNGSLEKWLFSNGRNSSTHLKLLQRLNIAIDVASAIHYLHDDCDQPIIHCDLKPSNVPLDNEMVAHVSDFGLARLLSNTTSISKSQNGGQTSTTGMNGTIGYVAPEYAMGGEPSKEGDVYSHGILLLEMFTGKRPTDEIFRDDFNLHNFVKMALPERLDEIVDSTLFPPEAEENAQRELDARNYNNMNIGGIGIEIEEVMGNQISADHLRKCLVSVLEIGIACSKESPNERMNMRDVTRELQHIKNAYMSFETNGQRRRAN